MADARSTPRPRPSSPAPTRAAALAAAAVAATVEEVLASAAVSVAVVAVVAVSAAAGVGVGEVVVVMVAVALVSPGTSSGHAVHRPMSASCKAVFICNKKFFFRIEDRMGPSNPPFSPLSPRKSFKKKTISTKIFFQFNFCFCPWVERVKPSSALVCASLPFVSLLFSILKKRGKRKGRKKEKKEKIREEGRGAFFARHSLTLEMRVGCTSALGSEKSQ